MTTTSRPLEPPRLSVPQLCGPGVRHTWVPMAVAAVLMVGVAMLALCTGPVAVPPSQVIGTLLAHVPLLHFHTSTPAINQAVVWQLRAPRVVLAGVVGAMLASGGAAYQGLFRNPLADPYLLGVAAGAGLGATIDIVEAGTPRRCCRSLPSSAARWPLPPPTSSGSPGDDGPGAAASSSPGSPWLPF